MHVRLRQAPNQSLQSGTLVCTRTECTGSSVNHTRLELSTPKQSLNGHFQTNHFHSDD